MRQNSLGLSVFVFSWAYCVSKKFDATMCIMGSDPTTTPQIRQSTIYYAGLLGRWDKQIVDQESDVPSIFTLFIDLWHSKLFIFIFVIL